jgi:hypothetical protein
MEEEEMRGKEEKSGRGAREIGSRAELKLSVCSHSTIKKKLAAKKSRSSRPGDQLARHSQNFRDTPGPD